MLPSTWTGRTLRILYEAGGGREAKITATLLDFCGAGVIVNLEGFLTLICGERLILAELVPD